MSFLKTLMDFIENLVSQLVKLLKFTEIETKKNALSVEENSSETLELVVEETTSLEESAIPQLARALSRTLSLTSVRTLEKIFSTPVMLTDMKQILWLPSDLA